MRTHSAWRGPQARAAVAILVGAMAWRGFLMAGSYFNQDDFYLTGRAWRSDLTWSFLVRDTAGHVNPLQQLTYWVVAHHFPYDWAAVGGFVLLLQGMTLVVTWLVLSRLLPGRPVRLVLLGVLAVAPATLATTLWWSAAMGLWPHLLCSMTATLFLLRARDGAGPSWADQVVVVLAFVTGLLWHERAVLIAPVLLAVAVLSMDPPPGRNRVWHALRRFPVLWVALALVLASFLLVHARLTNVTGGDSSASKLASISWTFLARNVVPGLMGGPWTAHLSGGAVETPLWVTLASAAALLVVGAAVVRRGGPARWWAVAALVGYVLADLALLLAGRSGFGRVIGLDPRYSSDVVHAAVLFCACALRGARTPAASVPTPLPRPSRGRSLVLPAAGLAYLLAAISGTAVLVPHFQNREDREYVDHLRDGLRDDPNQVLWDELAPADVVLPLVGRDSELSRIFAPLPESPVFDLPSSRLRTVDARGQLSPIELKDAVPALTGPRAGCGYAVRARPVHINFPFPLSGRLLLQASFFTDTESTVRMTVGYWSKTFEVAPGPGEILLPVPDVGAFSGPELRVVGGDATVCFTEVTAGLP